MIDNQSTIDRQLSHVYTSYFANWRQFPEGSISISISQYPPKKWGGLEMRSCAPNTALLQDYKNGNIDEYIFKQRYLAQLEKDVNLRERVKNLLNGLMQQFNADLILCCYEKSGDFCHRHILAEWLKPEFDITEL